MNSDTLPILNDLAGPLTRAGTQPARITLLNQQSIAVGGKFVLYWMQASQRAKYNHALEAAVLCANRLGLPLVVGFALTAKYPGANLRHYAFMLQGLREVGAALAKRGIRFVLRKGAPPRVIAELGRDAALVVTDAGYTRMQIAWREEVARALACPLVQVESDVVVPIETASDKEEYAARTIRPKILRQLGDYMIPLKRVRPKVGDVSKRRFSSLDWAKPETILKAFDVDGRIGPSPCFVGGAGEAEIRLKRFLKAGLSRYEPGSNDPNAGACSLLSPYLHFGQISPLEIALRVAKVSGESADSFLEQLIVRRELAINFVYYNEQYDDYACLPDWAKRTLRKHGSDARAYTYSEDELSRAATHDPAWNAAQMQMVKTGHMHNYMRMYWGKKILEWTPRPQDAYAMMLRLNDAYELDGRDPNGFTGVAWCFGKHDRPWGEREIFGTVRYMNDKGLRRKFDVDGYCRMVDDLPG